MLNPKKITQSHGKKKKERKKKEKKNTVSYIANSHQVMYSCLIKRRRLRLNKNNNYTNKERAITNEYLTMTFKVTLCGTGVIFGN